MTLCARACSQSPRRLIVEVQHSAYGLHPSRRVARIQVCFYCCDTTATGNELITVVCSSFIQPFRAFSIALFDPSSMTRGNPVNELDV